MRKTVKPEAPGRRGALSGVLLATAVLTVPGAGAVAAPAGAGPVAQAVAAAAPARIERVRYQADGGSTRVIVILSRAVPCEVRVLPGESARGSERRLVLDFSNARLAGGAAQPIGVEDSLLKQIRTGQFTARTARVVLDLASVTGHSITVLDHPPRVVIDITGRAVREQVAGRSASDTAGGTPTPAGKRAAANTAAAVPPPAPAGEAGDTGPARGAEGAATDAARAGEPMARAAGRQAPDGAERPPAPEGQASAERSPARSTPWVIVIDPGHGGADPGTRGVDGVFEKDVTLAIAQRLKRRLEQGLRARVLLTRAADASRSLAERTAFANANGADLFVSIHTNADAAGELHGIETYTLNNTNERATMRLAKMENGPGVRTGRGDLTYILSDMVQSGKEEESVVLAQRVHARLLDRLRSRYPGVRDLGVKKGPFYVLVGAYMPCVLVETSFLSHPIEGRRLTSGAYQDQIAEGLFLGVADFLGDARLAKTL